MESIEKSSIIRTIWNYSPRFISPVLGLLFVVYFTKIKSNSSIVDFYASTQFFVMLSLLSQEPLIYKEYKDGGILKYLLRSFFVFLVLLFFYQFFEKPNVNIEILAVIGGIQLMLRYCSLILVGKDKYWLSLFCDVGALLVVILWYNVTLKFLSASVFSVLFLGLLTPLLLLNKADASNLRNLFFVTLLGSVGSALPSFIAGYLLKGEALNSLFFTLKIGGLPKMAIAPLIAIGYTKITKNKMDLDFQKIFKTVVVLLLFGSLLIYYIDVNSIYLYAASLIYIYFMPSSIILAQEFKQSIIARAQLLSIVVSLSLTIIVGSNQAKIYVFVVANTLITNALIRYYEKRY